MNKNYISSTANVNQKKLAKFYKQQYMYSLYKYASSLTLLH